MQTPHPDTYPVIQKKIKVNRYQMFFLDILRLKVGSFQWLWGAKKRQKSVMQ
jgi:hypothetical protein